MDRWHTDKTTRFIVRRICENCGGEGWGTYGEHRRCHNCGQIVANLTPEGTYVDDDD